MERGGVRTLTGQAAPVLLTGRLDDVTTSRRSPAAFDIGRYKYRFEPVRVAVEAIADEHTLIAEPFEIVGANPISTKKTNETVPGGTHALTLAAAIDREEQYRSEPDTVPLDEPFEDFEIRIESDSQLRITPLLSKHPT